MITLTHNDPRFKKAIVNLEKSAAQAREHPPAIEKATEAQAAALPPANEKLAGAQANQVEVMQQAETGKPEKTSFLEMLRAEIKEVTPKVTEDVEGFMEGDDRTQLKDAMTGNIDEQKAAATAGVRTASDQTPDPSRVSGKEVTSLPAPSDPATPSPVGAAEAMPLPLPETDVETNAQQVATDFQTSLTEQKITPEQLRKANDTRFTTVLTAKSKVDRFAETAPPQFRLQEGGTLSRARAGARANERAGLGAFQTQQVLSGEAVQTRQLDAKSKDEQRRQDVADNIEAIYTETKAAVDQKLESLETDVSTLFDTGTDSAVTAMREYIDTRFDERYSGASGAALWVKDSLLPLPDEVQAWFDEAYAVFLAALDALVVQVADKVETCLQEAKDEVNKGQKRIQVYVESLPKDLQEVGKAAEAEVQARFDDMRKGVDDKKADLAQKLAQRYKEASDKGSAALQEMRDAHKSLYEQAAEALGEVVEILRNFKERVMRLIKKAESAIDLIVADPIGFLENLLNAVMQGLNQFVDNIGTHLKAGLMTWLFGTLTKAGVTPPKDFSLPSILQLVLQILGLTYDRIRLKAVKLIGERNGMLLEGAWEILSTLLKGGPAALWEQVKEYLSDLKEQVVDAIQDWLISAIIKAAVTKLVSMFNPVGAIIQAILTIYQVVTFFIEKINQIMAFVEAIVESVYNIATGAIGPAANWIEQALARTIPLIIDFLARLLGLSGISEKIKEIIQKIRAKVDKAIDKLIEKVVAGIRKLVQAGQGLAQRGLKGLSDLFSRIKSRILASITGGGMPGPQFFALLDTLKRDNKLKDIDLVPTGKDNVYQVITTVNPPVPLATVKVWVVTPPRSSSEDREFTKVETQKPGGIQGEGKRRHIDLPIRGQIQKVLQDREASGWQFEFVPLKLDPTVDDRDLLDKSDGLNSVPAGYKAYARITAYRSDEREDKWGILDDDKGKVTGSSIGTAYNKTGTRERVISEFVKQPPPGVNTLKQNYQKYHQFNKDKFKTYLKQLPEDQGEKDKKMEEYRQASKEFTEAGDSIRDKLRQAEKKKEFEPGHLISSKMNGPDVAQNLAPQTISSNRAYSVVVENWIHAELKKIEAENATVNVLNNIEVNYDSSEIVVERILKTLITGRPEPDVQGQPYKFKRRIPKKYKTKVIIRSSTAIAPLSYSGSSLVSTSPIPANEIIATKKMHPEIKTDIRIKTKDLSTTTKIAKDKTVITPEEVSAKKARDTGLLAAAQQASAAGTPMEEKQVLWEKRQDALSPTDIKEARDYGAPSGGHQVIREFNVSND